MQISRDPTVLIIHHFSLRFRLSLSRVLEGRYLLNIEMEPDSRLDIPLAPTTIQMMTLSRTALEIVVSRILSQMRTETTNN
jgi:hypothetical protein